VARLGFATLGLQTYLTEGKDYVRADGDVVEFGFNV
jgi:hypothetical protein